MGKIFLLLYGIIAYGISLGTLLYTIGFVGNLFFPRTIDDAIEAPLAQALLIDSLLLALFAVQHSAMARAPFKKRWAQIFPRAAERSTYVLFASLALLFLFWQWRSVPEIVWDIGNPWAQRVLEVLFWLGWLIAFHSTFLIDHADFFGLRQVYLYWQGKEYTPVKFKMPELYRHVRHPIMMGLLISFWSTPVMTLGHLLFALGMTAYIFAGVRLEERDLIRLYGKAYEEYRRRVPLILPWPKKG